MHHGSDDGRRPTTEDAWHRGESNRQLISLESRVGSPQRALERRASKLRRPEALARP